MIRMSADVGGTFTDVVLQRPDGTVACLKVLSSPPNYDSAVVKAIRSLISDEERIGGEVARFPR